jgi:hypothetical protein
MNKKVGDGEFAEGAELGVARLECSINPAPLASARGAGLSYVPISQELKYFSCSGVRVSI